MTDAAALDCVIDAVGSVALEIEGLLSQGLPDTPMANSTIRVVGGNFITAKPVGVLDGVDMQYAGQVRKVDAEGIRAQLGIGNIVRAFRDDFDAALACPEALCRPASILARAGYGARGFAYLPLGVFVILAGLHARAGEVTSTAGALDALEAQPGGSWILGLTAAGLMAFGAFAFVEARWRRIRAPRELG